MSNLESLLLKLKAIDEAVNTETETGNPPSMEDEVQEAGEVAVVEPADQGGAGASDEGMDECPQDGNVQLSMADLLKLMHRMQKGNVPQPDQTLLGDEGVGEEFANAQADAPGPEVAPVAAVIRKGNDLASKGDEAPKVNGGGNPLQAQLAELYAQVKERPVEEGSAHGYNVVKWYEKWGDQIKLTKWLKKEAGLDRKAPVYFDDADLVYGDETIVPNALVNPKLKLVDLLNAVMQASGSSEQFGKLDSGTYRHQSHIDQFNANRPGHNVAQSLKEANMVRRKLLGK